jgi:hypothetical protein
VSYLPVCIAVTPHISIDCIDMAGVNFISVKNTNFLYKHHFGSFYYVHVTKVKLLKQRSYEKFVCLTLMIFKPGSHGDSSIFGDSPKPFTVYNTIGSSASRWACIVGL